MIQLSGARALVTGGASGIGACIVSNLIEAGSSVVVVDLRKPALGDWLEADATKPAKFFDEAVSRLGGLDAVMLNAGILTGIGHPRDVDEATYRRAVSINIDGVVLGITEAAKRMTSGSIVATASLAGIGLMEADPLYTMTKHAVVGYVRAASLHLRDIALNAVCPGVVDTPLLGKAERDVLSEVGFPLMQPSQVANAVLYALTTEGTGRAIIVQPGRDPIEYRFHGVPGPIGGEVLPQIV